MTWAHLINLTQTCFFKGNLDPVSITGKTPYREISWSLEALRLAVEIITWIFNLTGTSAAVLPRCLSNFRAIEQFQYKSRDFESSRGLTKRRLSKYWNGALVSYLEGLYCKLYWHFITLKLVAKNAIKYDQILQEIHSNWPPLTVNACAKTGTTTDIWIKFDDGSGCGGGCPVRFYASIKTD